MKIVWRKHNLIISSLVGSSRSDRYSHEIPMNTNQAEETSV